MMGVSCWAPPLMLEWTPQPFLAPSGSYLGELQAAGCSRFWSIFCMNQAWNLSARAQTDYRAAMCWLKAGWQLSWSIAVLRLMSGEGIRPMSEVKLGVWHNEEAPLRQTPVKV